ncbi:PadR family transcriptional regulator [Microbacterium rhizosphaerae]|uniref:PadR family transcriptional regulator n=1 Tax=Microbacterium rhizosphaerae TaxID=1678237 RepID=A0ABZ0SQG1_9MICO|nr:PadR family transcriptional regulator [Microbacterium rhizosphaerae]WPR90425.1 PadR family transcriptional regulator [Microbacterium rhizosphaerae]
MPDLNLLESVLLGLLVRTPAAGYDLRRYLEDQGRVFGYTPQSSQIYRQLAALVDRGLLEYAVDTERGGPDAKVYTPTPAGVASFLAWAQAPFEPTPRPMDAHFQRHFALAGGLSPVLALRIVETELAYRVAQERDYEPVGFLAESDSATGALFDPDWAAEARFLGDARGHALAAVHISWLTTTRRRLLHVVERTGAAWPDERWVAASRS